MSLGIKTQAIAKRHKQTLRPTKLIDTTKSLSRWKFLLMTMCVSVGDLLGCGGKNSESSFVLPPPSALKSETLLIPAGNEWIAPIMTISTDAKKYKPRTSINVLATIESKNFEDLPSSLTVTLTDDRGKIYSSCRPRPRFHENATYVLSGFVDTPDVPGVYHLKSVMTKMLIVTDKTGVTGFHDQKRELSEIVVDTR